MNDKLLSITNNSGQLIPRSTQPGHPSVGRHNECQQKLGRTQPH